MRSIILFSFFFVAFGFFRVSAATAKSFSSSEMRSVYSEHKTKKNPNLLFRKIKKKLQHTKKVMAAILAFPLPFGILALHRIYLGTKPYVPVMYILTAGGVFGILPFIDFCVLLLDNDIDRFYNNGKVFMWIK